MKIETLQHKALPFLLYIKPAQHISHAGLT
jgi:hypothetical protein